MATVSSSKRAPAFRIRWGHLAIYAALILVAIFTLVPLVWMLSTSLKEPTAVFETPIRWLPRPAVWHNYVEAWQSAPFGLYFYNSFKIAVLSVIGRLIVCAMGGYAFARLRFPGSGIAFAMLMAAMMIPHTVTLIPQYYIFKQLGWINTHMPLIAPSVFANTFGLFLMRQFFMTIPDELEEAARIDGASTLTIFWRIMLPLAQPALGALAIFTFMSSWNDFLGPLIYLNDPNKMTLQVGLAILQGSFDTEWHLLMAASVFVLAPILIVYIFAQRYFEEGIVMTGLKG